MLKKSFYFLSLLFTLTYLFINEYSYISWYKDIFLMPKMSAFPSQFSMVMDFESLLFLFMVLMVTCLVVMYGELYMEHYNNKKFFFLTMFFLLSMVTMSMGGNSMVVMMGWDGLGLSSLFLIMFYPSKTSMFNSFMTFFYNRLGDCVMVMIMCILINNSSLMFSLIMEKEKFLILVLLLICSFTKSAQFPLSSWLPAAMSAPTPISAMVHSSTLVTAGIYLIFKFFNFLEVSGLCMILIFFSCVTFLSGGFLGSMELDLKKIVAFSTMSQISMIILFCSTGMLALCATHMFFHSLFKTLLFCCCGLYFLNSYSDQLKKVFYMENSYFFFLLMMLLSTFCMSGLPFSSSFFSKDLFIESCSSYNYTSLFFVIMIGSYLTIQYTSKILSMMNLSFLSFNSSMNKKKNFFFYILFFSFLMLFSPFFIEFFLPMENFPVISSSDLCLFNLLMFLFFMIPIPFVGYLGVLSSEIYFSKFFMFGMFGKSMKMDKYSFHFIDHMMFKPHFFMNLNYEFSSTFKSIVLMFSIFMIYMVMT